MTLLSIAGLCLLLLSVMQQLQIARLSRKMAKLDPWTMGLVPVCSCGHGWGMHEESGRCYARQDNGIGLQCECRRCDAPPPLHLTT